MTHACIDASIGAFIGGLALGALIVAGAAAALIGVLNKMSGGIGGSD